VLFEVEEGTRSAQPRRFSKHFHSIVLFFHGNQPLRLETAVNSKDLFYIHILSLLAWLQGVKEDGRIVEDLKALWASL
jgi:hypothetical protein